jgi:hypothetical protein
MAGSDQQWQEVVAVALTIDALTDALGLAHDLFA